MEKSKDRNFTKELYSNVNVTKPPVSRNRLITEKGFLYEVIMKATKSSNVDVSLAGTAILHYFDKLLVVIREIEEYGLEEKKDGTNYK